MKPKALLLDLGNVTVRMRVAKFSEGLGAACDPALSPEEAWKRLCAPSSGYKEYERGSLDGRGFHSALRAALNLGLDYSAWTDLWNDFFEPNHAMEALLGHLRGQTRFWAISNNNAEHIAHLKLNFRVMDTFEGITSSHEVGAAKPEPAIYQDAIRSLGFAPQEILYLDDVAAYVAAGREQGLQAFHYTFNDIELRERLLYLGLSAPAVAGA